MSSPKVLIVGASRGIGFEFVRQYREQGSAVTATARSEPGLAALRDIGASTIAMDVADAESASRLSWQLDGARFDTAVYCAGVYGARTDGLDPPPAAVFDEVMHTNVLGAMRLLPSMAELLAPGARLAVLSSRMGSIGARTASGGSLYRASKAALNSVLKDVSLQLAGRAICVSLHPGWVRTDMGGAGADLDVAQSVTDLRRVLARLTPGDNGRFLDHDGSTIAW